MRGAKAQDAIDEMLQTGFISIDEHGKYCPGDGHNQSEQM